MTVITSLRDEVPEPLVMGGSTSSSSPCSGYTASPSRLGCWVLQSYLQCFFFGFWVHMMATSTQRYILVSRVSIQAGGLLPKPSKSQGLRNLGRPLGDFMYDPLWGLRGSSLGIFFKRMLQGPSSEFRTRELRASGTRVLSAEKS